MLVDWKSRLTLRSNSQPYAINCLQSPSQDSVFFIIDWDGVMCCDTWSDIWQAPRCYNICNSCLILPGRFQSRAGCKLLLSALTVCKMPPITRSIKTHILISEPRVITNCGEISKQRSANHLIGDRISAIISNFSLRLKLWPEARDQTLHVRDNAIRRITWPGHNNPPLRSTITPERHYCDDDQSPHVLHISDNTSLPQRCHPHTAENNGLIMSWRWTISAQVRPQSLTDVIVYGLLMQELIVWEDEENTRLCAI